MSNNSTSNNPVDKIRNIVISLVAIALGLALVFGSQTSLNDQSLEAQAKTATPLEVAISNQKPTLMEFYANWCSSCQAMSSDLAKLKQEFKGKVNFVMLNVDNSKWLPEVLNYNVDGIPHFVFLNPEGNAIAQSVGEQPLSIFQDNLQALIASQPLPYASIQGNISTITPRNQIQIGNQDNPRTHGNI
jgi:thioredoxin-like negative regulator of GroEL